MIDWKSMELVEVLNENAHVKDMALLVKARGTKCPEGAVTVLLVTKQGFADCSALLELLREPDTIRSVRIELLEENDIYHQYLVYFGSLLELKCTAIHPATPVHIAKYKRQERLFVQETPAIYARVTEPFIRQQSDARIKWIDNILAGVSEQDKIIYNAPDHATGFVLLPDSKWDQQNMAALYLLVLIRRRDVCSLRDLNGEHLALLKNIRDSVHRTIPVRYIGIKPAHLRLYIHYMPTYFYFHVHVVHVDLETPGCAVGTAHLLDDVIDNIEHIAQDYYAKRTLFYTLGVEHELYARILCDSE